MGSPSNFENAGINIAPNLSALELFSGWQSEFLCQLHFIGFLVNFIKTLGCDLSCCEDPSNLGSQEVSFLARERRVRVNGRIQISCQDMLDEPSKANVLWLAFWQLNPVVQNVISYPEHISVNSCASCFDATN